MWGRARHKRDHREVEGVVAEAEALLTGRLPRLYDTKGSPVASVNTLAHSSLDDLVGLSEQPRWSCPPGWDGAMSFLAHELVTMGRDAGGLGEVQRGALIPLELDLMAGYRPRPDTPGQLVGLVQSALERHQRDHRSRQP